LLRFVIFIVILVPLLIFPLAFGPLLSSPPPSWKDYVLLVAPADGGRTGQESLALLNKLVMMGLNPKPVYLFEHLGVGGVFNLSSSQVSRLVSIHPLLLDGESRVTLDNVTPGSPFNSSWSYSVSGPYTGLNVTVAIIDTGADYNLSALGGKLGVTVVGGYDFVNHDQDLSDSNGHGTAVASIIAGRSANFTGVAPDSKLLVYKVFEGDVTSSDLVVEALDRAAGDGAKIINLSLGGGLNSDLLWKLGYLLSEQGVELVAAVGNSGPDPSTISDPAELPPYISVGASRSIFSTEPIAELRLNGSRWFNTALPMLDSPLSGGVIDAKYVYVGSATLSDISGKDLSGKIAVALRDQKTFFAQMEENVASAGALALIVVNDMNLSLQGNLSLPTNSSYSPRIPVVTVSGLDGAILLQDHSPNSRLELQVMNVNSTLYPASFSSRGPVDDFTVKPEILAPGDDVPVLFPNGTYLMSGTSFSAPQVSGALAILAQEHPALSPVQYYSILTLTATNLYRMGEALPFSIQGAGELNITSAISASFVMSHQDYELLYPFSLGSYSDVVQVLFFSNLTLTVSYQGDYQLTLNQTTLNRESDTLMITADGRLPPQNGEDRLVFSDGLQNYTLPVELVGSSVGANFNPVNGSILFSAASTHPATGTITFPDGTLHPITLIPGQPVRLAGYYDTPESGYYRVSVTTDSFGGNSTARVMFYYPGNEENSFPNFVPSSIAAYSLALALFAAFIYLIRSVSRKRPEQKVGSSPISSAS
jgi:subtilisin family serine protease